MLALLQITNKVRREIMRKTVLIVDDDSDIVSLLRLFLELEGVAVVEASNGMEALALIKSIEIDLAIIDIMMPELDGFQLIKLMRKDFKLPIIILSAKSQDHDKILGLGIGADDYITKPFNTMEVMARVQALIRRTYEFNETSISTNNRKTAVGDLVLDHEECLLYKGGESIQLSSSEYKLLNLFMNAPGRIFTKKQIFENVWSDHYIDDDNAIMVQISRLREKIEDQPRNPQYIKTIRGLGYRFCKKEELDEK